MPDMNLYLQELRETEMELRETGYIGHPEFFK